MSGSLRLACIAACATLAGSFFLVPLGWAAAPEANQEARSAEREAAVKPSNLPREAEESIRQALRRPVTVDFHETPLEDVAAFLEHSCGIPVLLDFGALEDVGLKRNVPVSLRVSNISLRSALRLMLRELDLTCVVRHEVLIITTPEEAESWEVTRLYPVGDLAARRQTITGEMRHDFDSLMDMITTSVSADSWDESGPAPLFPVDLGNAAALVFRQTGEVHEHVASLLEAVRSIARQTAEGKTPEPVLFDHYWPEPPAYAVLGKALSQKVSLDFPDAALDEVIGHLREATGLNIVLERGALADVNVPPDAAVSIQVTDVPLESALRRLLGDLDLSYQIWDEVLVITTPEEAEIRLTIGVYAVGDLANPPEDWSRIQSIDDMLSELITRCVQPKTWDTVGGRGTLVPVDLEDLSVLVVVQTREVHQQVAEHLTRLRRIAREIRDNPEADPIALIKGLFDEVPSHKPMPDALAKKVDFDFNETPLRDIANFITEKCAVRCRVDERALDRYWQSADTPVSIHIGDITLRSALEIVLSQVDLTWVVHEGVLLITTPERAEKLLTLDLYPVGDLVTFRDQKGQLWEDYHSVIQALTSEVFPDTWDGIGGHGRIAPCAFAGVKALMVWQTDRAHEEIAVLLGKLQELASQASDDGQPPRRDRYYGGWGGGFF